MSVDVSVVIPSYNHATFVHQAVTSVLNQNGVNLELIVVDDGSSDASLDILKSFTDRRMRLISQTNQGAHVAINRGLAEAAGKYLAILNSDDIYPPQRLKKLVSILDGKPDVGLVGSYIEVINEQGGTLGIKHGFQDLSPWALDKPDQSFRAENNLRAALLTENYYATTSNFVFRQSLFKHLGPFLPLRYTHDWDFVLRVSQQTELELVPEPLLQYRVHSSNTIRENHAAMVFEICWILAMHLPQQLDKPWAYCENTVYQTEKLLNSIYTFGADRILNVLLLQQIHKNQDLALSLLEPTNPIRGVILDFFDGLQAQQ